MPYITVIYKYNGKLNIGVVDNSSSITHFERLKPTNDVGFDENIMYVMMVGDGEVPDIADLDKLVYDFSRVEDEVDFVVLANTVLSTFRRSVTFH